MATQVSEWKKKSTTELTMPSGNRCFVRRSGIEMFLKSGKVPNSLMPMMKAALTGNAPKEADKLEITDETIADMFEMFDLVATTVMLDPPCYSLPEEGKERQEDRLYVDEVDLEDKQFLFQWAVGGTADVAKFREGLARNVAAVQASATVLDSAEHAPVDS